MLNDRDIANVSPSFKDEIGDKVSSVCNVCNLYDVRKVIDGKRSKNRE